MAAEAILNASPKDALCARLRTDEFAIAIPFEDGAEEKIESFAEDLSAQLNLPVEILGAAIQVKASMLARWHHPAGGVVSPEVFIPIAEETGLIGDLSEALMRAAFAEAKQWHPSVSISVNISPKQLSDPWLTQKILKLLTETGFPPARLEIEITKSCLYEDLETAQSVVAGLKNQGIRLALDDFGTGYSSLSNIRAVPFDRIKIDRSFVIALNKDPESWTIVKTVAGLGASLGVQVTVEGVESAAIELRVRNLGCDLGQGWFFGQPATGLQTRHLLTEHGLYLPTGGESEKPKDIDSGSSQQIKTA